MKYIRYDNMKLIWRTRKINQLETKQEQTILYFYNYNELNNV